MDYDTDVNLVFKYYLSRQVNTAVVINENCKNSIDFYLLIAFLWMPKQYGYMAKIQKFKFTFWSLKHKKLTIKVAYLWQFGFFLCSPNCPKQPRIEYPF